MIIRLKTSKTLAAAVLLCLFCALAGLAQDGKLKTPTADEFKEDIVLGPCKNGERFEAVKKLFQKMGASESDFRIDTFKDIRNIVLTKKGKGEGTIIVGAHYDKVSDGCGTIDNWSGIVIMARLFQTISKIDTQKTYLFVAFDKEESGLLGSAAMVKSIPEEKRTDYCSMVNLDSFGMGYPVIIENVSTSNMTKLAKDLGKEVSLPVNGVWITGVGADSSSFKGKDIPAITITAISKKWSEVLHTPNDKIENLLPESVRSGYYFALQYIVKLEAGACDMFRKK